MKTCQQCGRPAVFRITDDNGELFLCVDCNLKLEHAETLEFQRTAQQFNAAAAAFESVSGLAGLVPRMPVPPTHAVPVANMNVNNINVNNSVIGVLNTGCISTVENAVATLKDAGSDEVAAAITAITQSVIDANTANNDTRNQILELLSVVAEEATKPEHERRSAVVRPLLQEVGTALSGIAEVSQSLWQQYGPMIQAFFG